MPISASHTEEWQWSIWFFLEVLVGGLLSGIMYSLVALGFVLIYKASSVFNFAQGAMVFFAVLSFVGFMELGLPFWAALPVTVGLMVLVGMGTERFVLRPLVNQSEDTLLMATIGLAFVIEGVAQLAWGVDVRRLDLGIRDEPINWVMDTTGMLISQLDITAGGGRRRHGGGAGAAVLAHQGRARFARGRGRSCRGAVDRHSAQAHLDAGLGDRRRRRAGRRHVVGRAQRRSVRAGVGRAEGVASADHRRLHLGARRHRRRPDCRRGRRRSARSISVPMFGGGIEGWSPYMLAVLFLLVRPEGLFGEKIIRRV